MVEGAAIDRTAILKAWAVSLLRIQAKVGHALFTIEQWRGEGIIHYGRSFTSTSICAHSSPPEGSSDNPCF